MNFSIYVNNIYDKNKGNGEEKNSKAIKSMLATITDYGWFVKALLFNSGCTHFKDDSRPVDSEKSLLRDLFRGKGRSFHESYPYEKMPKHINRKKLASFFRVELDEDDVLKKILWNFGMNEDVSPNRDLLIALLCEQFQYIVDCPKGAVENIIKDRYLDMARSKEFARFASQKEFDNTLQDLEDLQLALPTLRTIMYLLKQYDFISAPFPTLVIERFDESAAILSPMNFLTPELENARVEYLGKQAALCKHMLRVTEFAVDEGHKQTDFKKMRRFPFVLVPDPIMKDETVSTDGGKFAYAKNLMEELRESLYVVIDRIVKLESDMCERCPKKESSN